MRIELPEGWRWDPPTRTESRAEGAVASFGGRISEQDGAVVIERTLELSADRVAPEDYPLLRETVAAALAAQQTPLVLVVAD